MNLDTSEKSILLTNVGFALWNTKNKRYYRCKTWTYSTYATKCKSKLYNPSDWEIHKVSLLKTAVLKE